MSTLAASVIPYQLQIISADAQTHTEQAPLYLTDKVAAKVDMQSHTGLHSASTSKYWTHQIRQMWLFLCRTFLVEHSQIMFNRGRTPPHSRDLKTVLFQRAFLDS